MSDLIRREDAIALTQRAIDGYGQKMRDAAVKAEKRDWQSMLFAAVDIDAAIRALPAVQPDAADRIEALTAERDRLREALQQFLIEYDEVDLANAEPSSLTAAVLSARAALKGETP